jgi:signal transduction histidine kinase
MMLDVLLTLITQGLYLLIALVSVVNLLRRRDRPRLDIALIFGTLGLIIILQSVGKLAGEAGRWVNVLGSILLVAHPYLILRLVEHFRPISPWLKRVGLGGLLVSAALLLIFTNQTSLPLPVTMLIVAYFIGIEGYTTFAFCQGATTTIGLTRRRLALAAAGSGLLALLILLAGIAAVRPLPDWVLSGLGQGCAILSGVCYYFSFATPGWVSRYWQLSELYRFLRAVKQQDAGRQTTKMVLEALCQAAVRAVGGIAAGVILWQDDEQQFTLYSAPVVQPDFNGAIPLPPNDDLIDRVRQAGQPLLAATAAELGVESARLVAAMKANALYAIPIATEQQTWGVLLVIRRGYPLFAMDDLNLLMLLAEESAGILNYALLVNEQQRLIGQLRQQTSQLEAANQELEAFSYSVSHDLRAPLRSLDGFSQLLLEEYHDQLAGEGQDYVRRIQAASERMGQLIEDLLRLARVTQVEMRSEAVNLDELVRTIATELQWQEPTRQVTFVVADHLTVQGDEHLLRAALENLLNNAWKFTGKRSQARIEFGVLEQDGQPIYFVRDNGVGFNMAYADKLFNTFQRLHSATEFPGSGIGLATVRRIIQRHGGRIWAESSAEQGTTFYFTLS